jgi:hypothetical protein
MVSLLPGGRRRTPRAITAITLTSGALLAVAPPIGAQESVDSLENLATTAVRAVVLIDVQTGTDKRQGSGFLVDSTGRILTNYHVVRDARTVRVKFESGDVYDAVSILATDERRDLAVLQIAGYNLPALRLGDSDSLRIGTPVVLIGSPLGLANTVTTGIISGRRQEPEGYQLLQISAPASRGSSGGPVLTLSGRVVGVASSQMQAGQNLNFAVPINYARGLLTHLRGDPIALSPTSGPQPEEMAVTAAPPSNAVNQGLDYDLEGFGGFTLETRSSLGDDRSTRTRIAYRIIETLGGGPPRIERYMESETTRRTEPFGTEQTVQRERSRILAHLDGLVPVSARGETAWWTGESWKSAQYDLHFDGTRVRGLVSDTAGRAEELDRELPLGIILRDLKELAFATLRADSLVGRSVEMVTFDPASAETTHERYDILGTSDVRAAEQSYRALRVNVASGLSNVVAYFRAEPPRILLRRESEDGTSTEEVTLLEILPRRTR